eukprot:Clim_evm60s157 gene=Clim_evmTU60s157
MEDELDLSLRNLRSQLTGFQARSFDKVLVRFIGILREMKEQVTAQKIDDLATCQKDLHQAAEVMKTTLTEVMQRQPGTKESPDGELQAFVQGYMQELAMLTAVQMDITNDTSPSLIETYILAAQARPYTTSKEQ